MFKQRLTCGVRARGWVKYYPFFEYQKRNAAWHLGTSARAGVNPMNPNYNLPLAFGWV